MRSDIGELTKSHSKEIYDNLLGAVEYQTAHQFIAEVYDLYKSTYPSNPSMNGRIFEYLVCETLAHEGIIPFYYQARINLVPNADFDVALYHPRKPVVLTMKTSLRERYKQADLEGAALKQVYRRAKVYLITLSLGEADNVSKKIDAGDVLGLDACIVASQPLYTDFLESLKAYEFVPAKPLIPIAGSRHPVESIELPKLS